MILFFPMYLEHLSYLLLLTLTYFFFFFFYDGSFLPTFEQSILYFNSYQQLYCDLATVTSTADLKLDRRSSLSCC